MRFSTVKRLWFAADVYETTRDDDGNVESEEFKGTRFLSLDTGDVNALSIDSDEPLQVGVILRNIKDRYGDLVYPSVFNNTGQAYEVYHEEPILSPFGTREGFTSKANRVG